MTREEFSALLDRHERAKAAHETACRILEEEPNREQARAVDRLYREFLALDELVEAEIAAEREAES